MDGYNVYRRAAASGGWVKLNASLIQNLDYVDTSAYPAMTISSAATVGDNTTYYYAITSVDQYGDESVRSAALSPPVLALSLGGNADGSSGGGGCFVSVVQTEFPSMALQMALTFGGVFLFFLIIIRRDHRQKL